MAPEYSDDGEGIPDATELLRRIRPEVIVADEKASTGYRLSTQAFEDSKDGTPCSVAVRHLAKPVSEICQQYPGYGLASVTAGDGRQQQQGVCFWPDPDEPGHAYLFGNKSRSVRKALAEAAKHVAGPKPWG